VAVRGPASSVVEVGEGAPVAGTPARARVRAAGAQTLAPAELAVEMGRAASWRPGDVELWPGGAERGRRGKIGSLTGSEGRRERPTLLHPSACAYILRTICRGGS